MRDGAQKALAEGAGLGRQRAGTCLLGLTPAPLATHLDRLSVTRPQEALVVRLDAKSHKGARGDISPVPARCHAFPTLEKKWGNEIAGEVQTGDLDS